MIKHVPHHELMSDAMSTHPRRKYKVRLICSRCGNLINETSEIDTIEEARKIHQDALTNPLIGWCKDCDWKPDPHIINLREGLERKWGKTR